MSAIVLKPDPDDPDWEWFAEQLFLMLTGREDRLPGRCAGDYQFAVPLLGSGGFDIEATLALFQSRGGGCDCEILLNVDRPMLEFAELLSNGGPPTA